VILRHIASPPYAAWIYVKSARGPLFQAGTNGVTQAWRQVRVSVAARGPVRPRPLAVGITENGQTDRAFPSPRRPGWSSHGVYSLNREHARRSNHRVSAQEAA